MAQLSRAALPRHGAWGLVLRGRERERDARLIILASRARCSPQDAVDVEELLKQGSPVKNDLVESMVKSQQLKEAQKMKEALQNRLKYIEQDIEILNEPKGKQCSSSLSKCNQNSLLHVGFLGPSACGQLPG